MKPWCNQTSADDVQAQAIFVLLTALPDALFVGGRRHAPHVSKAPTALQSAWISSSCMRGVRLYFYGERGADERIFGMC